MFFSTWIDSFSSIWSQSNALQICNTDGVCWKFFKIAFQFRTSLLLFLFDIPVTTVLATPCKKSRQISAKLCSCLRIQPAAIKMEAAWMEYEICETDTWLSTGWGQCFSWCIKCSLNPSIGGADSASTALTLWSTFCEPGKMHINILNPRSQRMDRKHWARMLKLGFEA